MKTNLNTTDNMFLLETSYYHLYAWHTTYGSKTYHIDECTYIFCMSSVSNGFWMKSNQTKYFFNLFKNSLKPTVRQHVDRTKMFQSDESWLYNLSRSTLLYNARIIFGKKPNVCDKYKPLISFMASNTLMLHFPRKSTYNCCYQLLPKSLSVVKRMAASEIISEKLVSLEV